MDFFLWKFPMYKRKQPFPVIFAGLFFRFFFSTLNSSEPVWTSLLHFFLFGLGSSWQQATAAAKLKVQSPAVTDVLSFMGYEPPFEVKMTDQDGKEKMNAAQYWKSYMQVQPLSRFDHAVSILLSSCPVSSAFLAPQVTIWGPRAACARETRDRNVQGAVRKVCLGGSSNSSQVSQQNTHTLVHLGTFFSAGFALFGNRTYLEISGKFGNFHLEISNRPKIKFSKTLGSR